MFLVGFVLHLMYRRSQPRAKEPADDRKEKITYRAVRDRLDLDVRLHPSPDPSLYGLIASHVAASPDEPIDYTGFPLIPSDEPERFYQPGARDVVAEPDTDDDTWKTVIAAVLSAHHNKLVDWQVLEHNIREVPFIEHVDNVLSHLDANDITANVRSVFLDLARHSADYNAVKWGILIGEMRELATPTLDDLMMMARHSEFTLPVCHALSRGTGWYPDRYSHLLDLLPVTEGVGLLHVVRHILDEPLFQHQPKTRRDAVVYAMRHGSIARYPLALDIIGREYFTELLDEGRNDELLALALLELLDTLVWEEAPPGHLAEHPGGAELVKRYLELIGFLPGSIETLGALRTLYITLGYETIAWPERTVLRERAMSMLLERLSRETLEKAIRDGNRQDIALLLIMEGELSDLAYLALEEFERVPTPLAADALGTVGTPEHLARMTEALPDRSEIRERARISPTTPLSAEFHQRSLLYATVIRHIGKIGTAEVIRRIKEAARDIHPSVRASAMVAMRSLPQWALDAESRELVRFCLGDSTEFVRDEATTTAAYHALHASLRRPGVGTVAPEAGIARN